MQHFIYSSESDGPVFCFIFGGSLFLGGAPCFIPAQPAVEILAVTLFCHAVLATCTASRIQPVGLYDYRDDVYYA